MSNDTTSSPVKKVDDKVKEYLLQKDLANLLEQFIVSCVENRPDDVLEHMENWARERRGGSAAPAPAPAAAAAEPTEEKVKEDPRPTEVVVKESWASISDKNVVAKNFFSVLFLQHKILKRTLLKDIDIENVLTPVLIEMFGQMVEGTLSDDAIKAVGDAHAEKRGLEQYHHQYFITAMHMALKMTLPKESFDSAGPHWQKFLTAGSERVSQLVKVASHAEEEETAAAAPAVDSTTSTPRDANAADAKKDADVKEISVQESWASIEDKAAVGDAFFNVLLLQHKTLKRTLLKDIDIDATLKPVLVSMFGQMVEGTLSDDAIKAVGDAHAEKRGLEQYHHQYFITAMLMALRIVLKEENFQASAEPWRKFLAEQSWRVGQLVPLKKSDTALDHQTQ